jgi:uncharacterized protein YcbX
VTVGTVAQLWRHPVKSMGGERLTSFELAAGGVPGDRQWALRPLDGTDRVLTARRTPPLLHALARLAGDDDVQIVLPDGRRLAGTGPDTDAALSAWLGFPVGLAAADPTVPAAYDVVLDDGTVVAMPTRPGSFQDSRSATLHLLSTATLDGDDPRRYRANVVVATDGLPFDDDAWIGRRLRIGATAEVVVTKPCTRCVMVTRDQPGLLTDRTRLTRLLPRGVNLGVMATVAVPGRVQAGDPVTFVDPPDA